MTSSERGCHGCITSCSDKGLSVIIAPDCPHPVRAADARVTDSPIALEAFAVDVTAEEVPAEECARQATAGTRPGRQRVRGEVR